MVEVADMSQVPDNFGPQDCAGRRVAVVLVNWNGWRECIECIDSLFAQNHGKFHIFVIDNDSRDSSVENIVRWCSAPKAESTWLRHPGVRLLSDESSVQPLPCQVIDCLSDAPTLASSGCQLTIIRSGRNLGFAGGCNLGIKGAGLENFDYFWFLNPDTVVHQDALVELLLRAEEVPGAGMLGSTLRYYDAPDTVQAMGGARLDRSDGTSRHIGQGAKVDDVPAEGSVIEKDLAYIMGASMLVTRRFIAEIGPMEEDYFLFYEEIDWALRAGRRFSLRYAPRSHVFHKSGSSTKVMPIFATGFYYRNRLRFVARFLPNQLAAAKWSLFKELLRHTARGRWRHVWLLLTILLTARRITANVQRH
jgi:GT2 family glycosyltransferase